MTKLTKEQKIEVVRLYQDGLFILQISKKLSIPRTTVCRIIKKSGIKIKNTKEVGLLRRKQFLNKDAEIIKFYQEGQTCKEIAKFFNRNATYIQRVLDRNNIKTRTADTWVRQFKLNENYFQEIDTPNKAMILGFLYADGNVIKQTTRIKISEKDRDFLEQIRQEVQSEKEIFNVLDRKSNKNYICLGLYSKKIANDLRRHGCEENKTFKIRFPLWLNKELWPAFISGYFFGDGSSVWARNRKVYPSGREVFSDRCTFQIVSNTNFINDLIKIIKTELNIHCSFRLNGKNKNIATLSIGGNFQLLKIMNWMYQEDFIKMPRKFKMFQEIIDKNSVKYETYLKTLSTQKIISEI